MIYELIETGRASALFAGWRDSVVWSALQGVMGKIYVDSLEKLIRGEKPENKNYCLPVELVFRDSVKKITE